MTRIISETRRLSFKDEPLLQGHAYSRLDKRSGLYPGIGLLIEGGRLAATHHQGVPLSRIASVRFQRALFVPEDQEKEVEFATDGISVAMTDPLRDSTDPLSIYAQADFHHSSRPNLGKFKDKTAEHKPDAALPHTIIGSHIYHPVTYPSSGILAVMLSMNIFADGTALLCFNPKICDTDLGRKYAQDNTLPLHLNLGFQGAELLEMMLAGFSEETPLAGFHVPSKIEEINYGPPVLPKDVEMLRVFIQRIQPGQFVFTVFNSRNGQIHAQVQNLQTTFWQRWKNPQERPTLAQFLGKRNRSA